MERIVPEKETITIEFKSDKKPIPDDGIIDSVVAFANTEGGELYLGVEDDGRISGIHPSHRDITRLAAFIANKTIPPQAVRVELIDEIAPVTEADLFAAPPKEPEKAPETEQMTQMDLF